MFKSKPSPDTVTEPPVWVYIPSSFFDIPSNLAVPSETVKLPFQVSVESNTKSPPLTSIVAFLVKSTFAPLAIAPSDIVNFEDDVPFPIVTFPPSI